MIQNSSVSSRSTSKSTKPKQAKDPLSDFRNFLFVVWSHLRLRAPTKRQYEIADFLQHAPKRRMVRAWRGAGKSWITYAYVCWRLYCDPQLNILIISASKAKADEFSMFVKRLIAEMPELTHLRPRADQRWSSVSFDVGPKGNDPNPSVKSAGITGQITGSRADEIIADDVETPENALTQGMREKLSEKIKEFDSILKPDENGKTSRITYLGTPQTEASIYDELPDRGYTVQVWPARYPAEGQRVKYGAMLCGGIVGEMNANPGLVGKSVESERFTDMDLAEREASIGRSTFLLQYMLDTSGADADRHPLKLRDLVVSNLDPENGPEKVVWAAAPEWIINDLPNVGIRPDRLYRPIPLPGINYVPYAGGVLAIDPAGTGTDETTYAVVKTINGLLFLLDAGGFAPGQGHADSTMAGLASIAAKHKVNKILVEANFGDGMYSKLLQPHLMRVYPVGVEEVKHSQQKERRICDVLEPVMNSHRLIVHAGLVQKDHDSTQAYSIEHAYRYQLFYQLTRITRDKGSLAKDDRLDALAMAVQYWAGVMALDTEKRVQQSRDAMMKAELERYMKHAIGQKPAGNRYAYRVASDR